ncbi:MAG: hypothetical protein AAFR84_12960 [Pseudomonadota bacterium]
MIVTAPPPALPKDHPELVALKREGAAFKEAAPSLTHAQAIELAARARGFKTYAAFRADLTRRAGRLSASAQS